MFINRKPFLKPLNPWELLVPFPWLIISLLKEMFKKDKGKRFTILGERASGKTTLHYFLTNGEIYFGEYKQTTREKTPKNTLRLEELELIVEESVDIGGARDMRDQWERLIRESDVVCYLIRGDKVYENDKSYIELVRDHIAQILPDKEGDYPLYLLITHLDKIPQYTEKSDVVKERIGETLKTSAFRKGTMALYGSLKTQEETEQLAHQLMYDILEKSESGKKIRDFYGGSVIY